MNFLFKQHVPVSRIKFNSSIMEELKADKNWKYESVPEGDQISLVKYDSKWFFLNMQERPIGYTPTKEVLDELDKISLPNNTQIDAILAHKTTENAKNTIYLEDIYAHNGHLVKEEFGERIKVLKLAASSCVNNIKLAELKNSAEECMNASPNSKIVIKNMLGKLTPNMFINTGVWWILNLDVK